MKTAIKEEMPKDAQKIAICNIKMKFNIFLRIDRDKTPG